jgi:hypothetical protein
MAIADALVPLQMGRYLASRLPQSLSMNDMG